MHKFLNKPLPIEFLTKERGRRLQNKNECRALRSKINLQFTNIDKAERIKERPTIKQSVIDDFERTYAQKSD